MTYGDFAWKDVMDRSAGDKRRTPRRRSKLRVAGEPAIYMDRDEFEWSWRVSRVVKTPLSRPQLDFVVSSFDRYGHRFGLDELAKPVLDAVVKRPPQSIWVRAEIGEDPGVRIAESVPPFPPHIDRSFEVEHLATRDSADAIKDELANVPTLVGGGFVGVYLSMGPLDVRDFGFGGPVRIMFDALAAPLGKDDRIRDLRVVAGHRDQVSTEIKIWLFD